MSLVRLHSNYDPSSSRIFAADGGVARAKRVGRGLEGAEIMPEFRATASKPWRTVAYEASVS